MTVHYETDRVTVHFGDCLDVLRGMPDESVDSVVTDPPYGLEFMGKEWDRPWAVSPTQGVGYAGRKDNLTLPSFGDNRNANCRTCGGRQRGAKRCTCATPKWDRDPADDMRAFQAWCQEWAAECLRVLKPGGHLVAFGGTRTYHRLACAIEDAGFEVRDSLMWLYGQGFPKSLDVSKAIDRAAGAEREVVGTKIGLPGYSTTDGNGDHRTYGRGLGNTGSGDAECAITAPATDDAARWSGWGTALKPSHEPIVLARKPLAGTVAGNVLAHGTGALNIGATRIGVAAGDEPAAGHRTATFGTMETRSGGDGSGGWQYEGKGRWPANVVLSHLDGCRQVGAVEDTVGGGASGSSGFVDGYQAGDGFVGTPVSVPVWECVDGCPVAELDAQSGVLTSGSRAPGTYRKPGYLYADGSVEMSALVGDAGGASRFFPQFGPPFRYEAKANSSERPTARNDDGHVAHPTVKPLDLMRWLVRLVTPPGGLVLEPFAGSGTTAEACLLEGFRCVAIEREPDYVDLIVARLTRRTDPVAHAQLTRDPDDHDDLLSLLAEEEA